MAGITLDQLPRDCFITIKNSHGGTYEVYYSNQQSSYYEFNGKKLGTLLFGISRENPSRLIYEIFNVATQKGFGPLLYDAAMEYVTKLTNGKGYLKSDPAAVSKYARPIWDYYFTKRSDVRKKPLDSVENELTPTKIDNVKQSAAKEIYGTKLDQTGKPAWANKPLSTGFQKDINLLKSDKFIFVESRQKIKTKEPTIVITKFVVYLLKENIAKLKMKIFKKDFSPLKLNDSSLKNSYLEEIKRKINIERITVNIEINEGTTEDNCVFSVNGGSFHDKWENEFKEIQLNILFNAGEEDVTKNLDTFVLRLKDLVAHEITHNDQNNRDSMEDDIEQDSYSFPSNVDTKYTSILRQVYDGFLSVQEVQAYVKGVMYYYKWDELFYNELNNIMMLPVTICLNDLFDIYQNDEKVEAKKLMFFINKLTEETLKFKHRILIYIEQHYRNVEISQDKIWVNIDNIKSYIKDKMNERFFSHYTKG